MSREAEEERAMIRRGEKRLSSLRIDRKQLLEAFHQGMLGQRVYERLREDLDARLLQPETGENEPASPPLITADARWSNAQSVFPIQTTRFAHKIHISPHCPGRWKRLCLCVIGQHFGSYALWRLSGRICDGHEGESGLRAGGRSLVSTIPDRI